MSQKRTNKDLIKSVFEINPIDATYEIVKMIHDLVMEDESVNEETKRKFLVLYLQYQMHHAMLFRKEKKVTIFFRTIKQKLLRRK